VNRRLRAFLLSSALLTALGLDAANAIAGQVTYFLPDFRPYWSSQSIQDIRFDVGRANDRLVSCDDWRLIDPNPPVGMTVLSFTLSSPNFGQGDLRLRHVNTAEGIAMYQTISYMDSAGVCSAVETDAPVAVIPAGQSGRWLPLAKFALYEVAKDGGLGAQVACQMKRWCCLVNTPTCSTRGPCPQLPFQGDNLNAGARDVYPFHFQDQFLPIEGIPSGVYWFEHEINPGGIMWESDYTNNSMFLMIEIDQDARTVQVLVPPDDSFATCPAP
jgi:hypothetical protein